jgi:hypothetical protein
MGKLLPVPYPGQSIEDYREQLVNFQKNYWSFLKPSKGGSKLIPLPPLNLIKKTKEMSSRKLSEHVEEELFNKEKRNTPKIVKDSKDFLSEESKTKIVKNITENGEYSAPVKKKKPYYKKRYNKPKPVEVIEEPVKSNDSIKAFTIGLILGVVATFIVINLIN